MSLRSIEPGYWLHLPVAMILTIYLPAGLLGLYAFGDSQAFAFMALLATFVATYYLTGRTAVRVLTRLGPSTPLARIGAAIPWQLLAWGAVVIYAGTMLVACLTTPAVPLRVALGGGTNLEIAQARAAFLVDRVGAEALMRYVAVIFGRSVLPALVAYLYFVRDRRRHVALLALMIAYSLSLEKASPIFALLPLVTMRAVERDYRAMLALVASLIACVGLWTYLAVGAPRAEQPSQSVSSQASDARASMIAPVGIGRQGDPRRHEVLHFLVPDSTYRTIQAQRLAFETSWLLNRIVWIPYVTAYDWLKVFDEVLHGKLHHGRSIGVVSWLMGEKRLDLERIVYEYQFGPSPHGAGGANTVFFVDARLAFGWAGVVVYCALFALCAAVVFACRNDVVKFASITSFFTASVSPLTATLLSGGLFFFVALAVLLPGGIERHPQNRR